jgi:hypothetical protein
VAGRKGVSVGGVIEPECADEIQRADLYETAEYVRVAVLLQSGTRAWVYVDARYPPSGPP